MKNINEVLAAVRSYESNHGRKPNKVLLNKTMWEAVRGEVYELNCLEYSRNGQPPIPHDVFYMGGFEVQYDPRAIIDIQTEF